MTALRVYRAEVHVTPEAQNALRVYRAEVHSTKPQNSLRVFRAEVRSTPGLANSLRVYRAAVNSATKPSAGSDVANIEPGTLVTVTGSGGSGGTGTWTQVSGPTVQLVQTGASASFYAPPSAGAGTVVLRYTVKGASDDVSIGIVTSIHWAATSSGWVGILEGY